MNNVTDAAREIPELLRIYVINLDRVADRWQTISSALDSVPWPVERISAFDCKGDVSAILGQRNQKIVDPPYGVGWNPLRLRMFSLVEEATFCSHLHALAVFLESGIAYGIIMEDDAAIESDFTNCVSSIINCELEFDVVKLESSRDSGARLAVVQEELENCRIVRSFRPASGAAAYLVSRKGARRLLDNAGQLRVPVDDYIWNTGLNGCLIYHAAPFPVTQSGAVSTMTAHRSHLRHRKKRDPVSFAIQGLRRGWLRLQLIHAALFRPTFNPLSIRKVPW